MSHFLDAAYCRFLLWLFIGAPLRRFGKNCSGATAVEYALIIGGIALTIIVIVFNIGESIESIFNVVHDYLA